jgi:hypothetical protein
MVRRSNANRSSTNDNRTGANYNSLNNHPCANYDHLGERWT